MRPVKSHTFAGRLYSVRSQAIPPAYTQWIAEQWLKELERKETE